MAHHGVDGRGAAGETGYPSFTASGPNHKWPMGHWCPRGGATWQDHGLVFFLGCSGLGLCLLFLS